MPTERPVTRDKTNTSLYSRALSEACQDRGAADHLDHPLPEAVHVGADAGRAARHTGQGRGKHLVVCVRAFADANASGHASGQCPMRPLPFKFSTPMPPVNAFVPPFRQRSCGRRRNQRPAQAAP
jgi:hypothetical protein